MSYEIYNNIGIYRSLELIQFLKALAVCQKKRKYESSETTENINCTPICSSSTPAKS
jgi:hypothetical protein